MVWNVSEVATEKWPPRMFFERWHGDRMLPRGDPITGRQALTIPSYLKATANSVALGVVAKSLTLTLTLEKTFVWTRVAVVEQDVDDRPQFLSYGLCHTS